MIQAQEIKLSKLHPNKGQIQGVPTNPRRATKEQIEKLKKSIEDTPTMLQLREIVAYDNGNDELVIIGGNMRYQALKALGHKTALVKVLPYGTPKETINAFIIKDNAQFGDWDTELLANEWDKDLLEDWGVDIDWGKEGILMEQPTSEDEIARKEREFREKMEAGEISEEDEEYQEFLEKFKLKKTTDDCYTPPIVFDAIADWVANEYKLDKANFVRPFYPGGDYQNELYKPTDIVVDNPPFSILSEILRFYKERGIKFFLYGPHLTLFSSAPTGCTAIPVGAAIIYENGANVNTSFLTNLEDKNIRAKSSPTLYAIIKEANERNLKATKRELPKYSYDGHIVMTPFFGQLSRYGIEFSLPVDESEPISQLDSQKEAGKAIFGKGYIMSERMFQLREKAEREKAEREKAEREKAERWELSEREIKIIAKLSMKK